LPAAGIESCASSWPALGAHIDVQSETAIGPPSRINAAWASGCRKLRVIANSAAAKVAARQPEAGRLRSMPKLRTNARQTEEEALSPYP
jgi:hypothetical protein